MNPRIFRGERLRSNNDPHYSDYKGRWLAGFARVPDTEFVVIVQQRYNDTGRPFSILARPLILWTTFLLGPLAIFIAATLWIRIQKALINPTPA